MLSSILTHVCVRIGIVTHTLEACLESRDEILLPLHAHRFLTGVRSRELQFIRLLSDLYYREVTQIMHFFSHKLRDVE